MKRYDVYAITIQYIKQGRCSIWHVAQEIDGPVDYQQPGNLVSHIMLTIFYFLVLGAIDTYMTCVQCYDNLNVSYNVNNQAREVNY